MKLQKIPKMSKTFRKSCLVEVDDSNEIWCPECEFPIKLVKDREKAIKELEEEWRVYESKPD